MLQVIKSKQDEVGNGSTCPDNVRADGWPSSAVVVAAGGVVSGTDEMAASTPSGSFSGSANKGK